MMNKFKNWWNKPLTIGWLFKSCAYGSIIGALTIVAELAWLSGWTPFKKR